MVKTVSLFALCSVVALAQIDSSLQLQQTTLKQGSTQDQVSSLFGKTAFKKSFLEGDLDVTAGIMGNVVLKKNAPLNFFTTLNYSQFLIDQLSADYYINNQTMVSLGREKMNLNLLNGSFDGALVASSFGDFFLKTYLFEHYSYLVPTLYENQNINELAGVTLNYTKAWFDSELSYFNENSEHRSDIYLGYLQKPFKAGVELLQFVSSTQPNERAYKLHMGARVKHFYGEVGYLDVYDGALNRIYQFGGSEFNTFGLTGFLNNQNAQNGYVDLLYRAKPLYVKLHGGETNFDVGATNYLGKEFGLTLGYTYRDIHATLQAMTQKSNQAGLLGQRTSWIHTNLEYRF